MYKMNLKLTSTSSSTCDFMKAETIYVKHAPLYNILLYRILRAVKSLNALYYSLVNVISNIMSCLTLYPTWRRNGAAFYRKFPKSILQFIYLLALNCMTTQHGRFILSLFFRTVNAMKPSQKREKMKKRNQPSLPYFLQLIFCSSFSYTLRLLFCISWTKLRSSK